MTLDSESAKWKAGSAILGLFVPDARVQLLGKLTLQEVRIVFYTSYANVARRISLAQIDQLTNLSENQLIALKVLGGRIEADVRRLNLTQTDLRRLNNP